MFLFCNLKADVNACPQKVCPSCGEDCDANSTSAGVQGESTKQWKPSSCKDQSCTYSKNLRTAQCILKSDVTKENYVATPLQSGEITPQKLKSIEDISVIIFIILFNTFFIYRYNINN